MLPKLVPPDQSTKAIEGAIEGGSNIVLRARLFLGLTRLEATLGFKKENKDSPDSGA